MRRFVNYFFQGLIFLVPIVLTAWFATTLFLGVDDFMRRFLGPQVRGLGFLFAIAAVTGVGLLASNFLTRGLLQLFETQVDRLPLLKLLHTSLKDLMSAFVGEKRRFNQPVLVEVVEGSGIRTVGFVTHGPMVKFGRPDDVAVYFPQSYHFAGQVVLVPSGRVTPLAVESAEVMAFIVSGGVSGK
jgi:uncharacterized membrane protein